MKRSESAALVPVFELRQLVESSAPASRCSRDRCLVPMDPAPMVGKMCLVEPAEALQQSFQPACCLLAADWIHSIDKLAAVVVPDIEALRGLVLLDVLLSPSSHVQQPDHAARSKSRMGDLVEHVPKLDLRQE